MTVVSKSVKIIVKLVINIYFDEHNKCSNVSKTRGLECYICMEEESKFSYYKTCGNECHLEHTLMPCDLHSNNFSV